MRIYYVNDTHFHSGSEAVSAAIRAKLQSQGHEIVAVAHRPSGPDPALMGGCDAMVVNGEGTFKGEKYNFEPQRQEAILFGMREAKRRHLRVHFINATWCDMTPGWGPILASLDEVAVREVASRNEMLTNQGVRPAIYPDMSYYAPVERTGAYTNAGKVIVGEIYPHNFPDGLSEANPMLHGLPSVPLRAGWSWSRIVNELRGALVYITGQHHGVYAACRARVPFVFCKVNTHKVSGLFEWANVNIPTVRRGEDILDCLAWALENRDVYERLFDFLDRAIPWPGILQEAR